MFLSADASRVKDKGKMKHKVKDIHEKVKDIYSV